MKVTLERNHLLKSLGHVHRVVERRNTYPILANVLLKAGDGGIDLRATDLDIEVTEKVPAMVGTPGTTTVPAHTLYEIVRKLADGSEVKLETTGEQIGPPCYTLSERVRRWDCAEVRSWLKQVRR